MNRILLHNVETDEIKSYIRKKKKKNRIFLLNSANLSDPVKKYLFKSICIHTFMKEVRCYYSTCGSSYVHNIPSFQRYSQKNIIMNVNF